MAAGVFQADRTRDHIFFREHTVQKLRFQPGGLIPEDHAQRFRLILRVSGGRQVLQCIRFFLSRNVPDTQITSAYALICYQIDRSSPEVSDIASRVFQRKLIHGIASAFPDIIGIHGKTMIGRNQ